MDRELDRWTAVDDFFWERLGTREDNLEQVLEASHAGGLPPANVAPNQGKLLRLLATMQGARSILELGTLGGYSTIWLAGALPADGHLVSIEADPDHVAVARQNIARAGYDRVVEVREGDALVELPRLAEEGLPPFDFVFIDADKRHNLEYFEWALKLTRSGSVIIVDNVVRGGAVLDAESADRSVIGTRRFADAMKDDSRVSATALQTVGSKGYDGFVVALVQ